MKRIYQTILCHALFGLLLAFFMGGAQADVKPDSGKFVILLQEAEAGSATFKMMADGTSECDGSLTLGGAPKITLHIVAKMKGGRLTEIFTDGGKVGKFGATFAGDKAKVTMDGKPLKTDQKLPARLYPFSDFSPHFYAYLLDAYDKQKGGPQKFDMLAADGVTPQGLIAMKMTLTAQGVKPRMVAGKTVVVSRYVLSIPGAIGNIDTDILADSEGRILLWGVTVQKFYAVRDGYQDLLKPETPDDPLLSKPVYNVKKEAKVFIPMRDGVKLAADVYRPDAPGKFPVILQRTPYGRGNAIEANFYVRRGYVFVAQDVRGRFDSQGEWHPFVKEAKDGYDSVEWCATQPWSTGDIGMIGGSYLGFVQWAAAREGNPHLKCLIPIVSPPDLFFNIPYAYGAFFLAPSLWWADVVKNKESINIQSPLKGMKNMGGLMTLPLKDVDKAVFGKHIPFIQEWLQHPTNDAYWDQVNFNNRMKNFGPLPALHVSGWFDGDGIGTKLNYAGMIAAGQQNQRLVYGPWGHAVNTTTKMGSLNFGPQSLRDLDTLYLRWFDHWLKGVENGVDKEPPVEAFLMGANEWRKFADWPPAEATQQKWYLHSQGHANADKSDGTLSLATPSAGEPADHYTYDPAKPYISAALKKAIKTGQVDDDLSLSESEKLPDLLHYTTVALKQDVVVAGPISLHLFAATSAKDTDWYALLEDVYPNGKSAGLCQGIIRARFRKSFTKPTLLKPGETAEYTVDLWALGNVFKKGHRIRVVLTSSCFPIYDRNLNTGENIATGTRMVKAKQTILHTLDHASYLLLPVLPK